MHSVTIPAPVNVVIRGQKKEITFLAFFKELIRNHGDFAQGEDMARRYDRLMKIAEAAEKEGKVVVSLQFMDEDFVHIKNAKKNSSWISPDVNRAYIPFYDALNNASEVKAEV